MKRREGGEVRYVAMTTTQGLLPHKLEQRELDLVPPQHQHTWMLYRATATAYPYPYNHPETNPHQWGRAAQEMRVMECGPVRLDRLTLNAHPFPSLAGDLTNPDPWDYRFARALPEKKYRDWQGQTVYASLAPHLTVLNERETLRLSAIGQTTMLDLSRHLMGWLSPRPWTGFSALGLILNHGPAAVERLFARAWEADVRVALGAADRLLAMEAKDPSVSSAPLEWLLEVAA